MLGPSDRQIVGKWWNMPEKPQERFTAGRQPCQNFLRGDADIAALGEGNRMNLHQCPKCCGNRAWCDNCSGDHHDGADEGLTMRRAQLRENLGFKDAAEFVRNPNEE